MGGPDKGPGYIKVYEGSAHAPVEAAPGTPDGRKAQEKILGTDLLGAAAHQLDIGNKAGASCLKSLLLHGSPKVQRKALDYVVDGTRRRGFPGEEEEGHFLEAWEGPNAPIPDLPEDQFQDLKAEWLSWWEGSAEAFEERAFIRALR